MAGAKRVTLEGYFNVFLSRLPDWDLAYNMLGIRGCILLSKLKVPDFQSPLLLPTTIGTLLSSMQEVSLVSVQTETKCYKLCYLRRIIPTSQTN